ncbi:YqeG family HAD IIIA-type phosphatase [Leptolyngbya sp. BL0902]|uniref:YqeG family HAD IIIA-type phosphatase n=1 Tax=Leptolyngbya sp. BL0902 TaxID=1115757 RepID=UPI0018E766D2|nr:YqeG family HAD IIIA-type phosphatase [Leptolyngbya sp. BL0902]
MVWSSLVQPNLVLGGSVFDLSPDLLHRHNLKGVILDVDDTLVPLRQVESDPDLIAWMTGIKAVGKVWLVSNNVNGSRIKRIANALEVPYLTSAGKPSRRKLKQALEAMDLPPEQVAMVGDRLLTDVLAGNRLGLFTILVDPMPNLDQDQPRFSLLRTLEVALLRAMGISLSAPPPPSQP